MEPASVDAEIRRLVDDYRTRCLWFLHEDYYPGTDRERERVLTWIEQHGDHAAFHRITQIRRWLSRSSNETSAVS